MTILQLMEDFLAEQRKNKKYKKLGFMTLYLADKTIGLNHNTTYYTKMLGYSKSSVYKWINELKEAEIETKRNFLNKI